jgi:uncharacterized heparinase superfamily protein
LWRALTPLRVWWRRTWLYRRYLRGPLTDHVAFHPYDALPRQLEEAEALLRARFHFAGETIDVKEGSIFDQISPSREWAEALHSFAWLPPLSAAGGDAARKLATNLIAQWIKRNGKYSEPAWLPHVMARRLVHLFAHGRMVIVNSDVMWRSKLFVSIREQVRMLARTAEEAPDGLPRFEAAAALALSGACLEDDPARLALGIKRLEEEIARQILPDGGHISRSPEILLQCYRQIVMVNDALTAASQEIPHALRSAHDRIAPMLRFFRHGDGRLALFHGGNEGHPKMISALLARDEVRGQPFAYAPHSGFQRLVVGKTSLVLDCGTPPPGAFSNAAHAGCLAFEMSASGDRLVVNCGAAGAEHPQWELPLRATAAHSTVTLDDCSMASVLQHGLTRDLMGPRLIGGASEVFTSRRETPQGWCVDAGHNGYQDLFGVRHERQITMAPQGLSVTGLDRLLPDSHARQPVAFVVRFHIHPDVRVSASQGGGILLKLPGGDGWRFRSGLPVSVEESVYLGSGQVRRCEQLVLSGFVKDSVVVVAWAFEQILSN